MAAFWQKSLKVWVCAALLGGGTAAWADTPPKPGSGKVQTETEKKLKRARSENRASNLFGLLVSEMALNKGDVRGALRAYQTLFERTRAPEVAERAMDIAVGLRDYAKAEQIYQAWLQIDAEKQHPGLRRADWLRGLMSGAYRQAAEGFADVLQHASENERARIFLHISQAAVDDDAAVPVLSDVVRKQAAQYADMPEEVAAEVVFAALGGRDDDALAGLNRLAEADGQLLPSGKTTLRLLELRRPELLARFWQQPQAVGLPYAWQTKRILFLLESGNHAEAFAALDQLPPEHADSGLYLIAVYSAAENQADEKRVRDYWSKGFQTAPSEKRDGLALAAAAHLFGQKDYAAARQWLERVGSEPSFASDKAVMRLMLDAAQERWGDAERSLKRVRSLKAAKQDGKLFTWSNVRYAELALAVKVVQERSPAEALKMLNRLYREAAAEQEDGLLDEILMERGILYADRIGNPAKAVADFRELLKRNPDNAEAKNSLGYTMLYLPNPDVDEAWKLISEAYREMPLSAAVNDSLGWAYFKKGEWEKALHYLEFAVQNEQEPEMAAHAGEVLWHLGRKDEAREMFRRAEQWTGSKKVLRDTLRRLGLDEPSASGRPLKGKSGKP